MSYSRGFLLKALRHTLTTDLLNRFRMRPRPSYILFCMVDHYEPGLGNAPADVQRDRVQKLLNLYPPLADRHRDAHGHRPRRTWFVPPHDHCHGTLRNVVSLCEAGYGEIELHLHHGKTAPDTSENLRRTLQLCVRDYSEFGIFGSFQGNKQYAFIHGDWALSNSCDGGKYCGVNDELEILLQTGCYADFTFPSCGESNPSQINSIYYADVRRHGPMAYDRGLPVSAGAGPQPGLLMIQGPVKLHWEGKRPTLGDGIHEPRHLTKEKIDTLVKAWVHVKGREDWIIVKTHTHGASREETVLGEPMHEAFAYLEEEYNDGINYILHYVTARELYNIIKAAEAGKAGDPEEFRNFLVQAPSYTSRPEKMEASEELRVAVEHTYRG